MIECFLCRLNEEFFSELKSELGQIRFAVNKSAVGWFLICVLLVVFSVEHIVLVFGLF